MTFCPGSGTRAARGHQHSLAHVRAHVHCRSGARWSARRPPAHTTRTMHAPGHHRACATQAVPARGLFGNSTGSDDVIFYFAIGSMCNREGMRRRGVESRAGWAARLPGFRLAFDLRGGFGNIRPAWGGEMHGVLHAMDAERWEKLRQIEAGYDVEDLTVYPYGEGVAAGGNDVAPQGVLPQGARMYGVKAKVFHIKAPMPDQKPSERYRRIILEGCQQHGVVSTWIDHLRSVECQPARPREQWRTLETHPSVDWLPEDDFGIFTPEQMDAMARVRPLCTIGEYVVQVDAGWNPIKYFAASYLIGGKDVPMVCTQAVFEPSLGPVKRYGDLTPDHIAWATDFALAALEDFGGTMTVVGRLSRPRPSDKVFDLSL
ncbi:unnamed protein product [Pedinophyceae sp. YPF-701]|nr:unnamed protein product [Pedinophyceae sp. YPF-701]